MPRPTASNRSHPLGFRALSRAVSWHRRKLAVLAAVGAALTGVNAAMPPDPPTVEVLRAAVRLDGGAVLGSRQLVVTRLPVEAVPDGALVDPDAVVGQQLIAPVAKGQVLTEVNVVSVGRSVRTGHVVAPLRLEDTDLAALLKIGDTVDVLAADGEARAAAVVAKAVRVVGLPRPPDPSGIGGSVGSSNGALLLLDVDSRTATLLAQAAATAKLSVVLR
ncbi:MAG TPA: SAF domain-containing protein [Propionibacteriaceae bacterium]